MKLLLVLCHALALFSFAIACTFDIQATPGINVTAPKDVSIRAHPRQFNAPSKKLRTRTLFTENYIWPESSHAVKDGLELNEIPYCFANAEAERVLEASFRVAITQWYGALGHPAGPSKEAGYAVVFTRLRDYCYKTDYQNILNPGTWNIPGREDALALHAGNGFSATVGYVHGEDAQPPHEPGRHKMVLQPLPQPAYPMLQSYIHEIGHVLGFGHAHQHPDPSKYLKFRCQNTKNYEQSITEALKYPQLKHLSRSQIAQMLCSKEGLAWAKVVDGWYPQYVTDPEDFDVDGPYDPDSVMHYFLAYSEVYPSGQFDPSKADISRITSDGREEQVPINWTPSAQDIKSLKWWYRWDRNAPRTPH